MPFMFICIGVAALACSLAVGWCVIKKQHCEVSYGKFKFCAN